MSSTRTNWPVQLNRGSPLTRGLVGWWAMVPPNGTQIQNLAGVGRYNGTLNNVTFAGPKLNGTGQACTFAGSYDNYIDLGEIPNSGSLAFYAWFNPSTINGFHTVFSKYLHYDTPISIDYLLRIEDLGGNAFGPIVYFGNGSGYVTAPGTGGTIQTTGVWYCVAFSYDANTQVGSIYLNGVLAGSNSVSSIASDAVNTYIGNNHINITTFGSEAFIGDIDTVALWNRPLTAKEIYRLWHPQTRWEMYAPMRRGFAGETAAGFDAATFPWMQEPPQRRERLEVVPY